MESCQEYNKRENNRRRKLAIKTITELTILTIYFNIMILLYYTFFLINFCNKIITSGEIVWESPSIICDSNRNLFFDK